MKPIRVGDLTVQPLLDGTALLRAAMWAGADWTTHRHLLDDDDTLTVPVGAFLVRVGDRCVLLDAGVGDVHDEMFDGGRLLDSLRAAGAEPGDVDTIVVSHLHSDHMGWLATDEGAVFANATVHIGAGDWQHFVVDVKGGSRRAERLRSIAGQVELVGDGVTVAPGVTTRHTPGHTPGHTSTVLSSGAERLVVLGDALHCPAQLTEAEWEFVYDVDKPLAVQTRRALLAEADVPGTSLLPCHFPGMQAARLVPATGASGWVLSG